MKDLVRKLDDAAKCDRSQVGKGELATRSHRDIRTKHQSHGMATHAVMKQSQEEKKAAIYDAFQLRYMAKPGLSAMVSSIHRIHSTHIPVHDSLRFRIKATRSLSESEKQRVVMVKSSDGKIDIAKAEMVGEWYEAKFRAFGDYWLEVDRIPPQIFVSGLYDGAVLREGATIVCTVKEDKKEIRSFRAELDGKWLMFEGLGPVFRYSVDEYCPIGEHELVIKVEDEAGNVTEKKINFTRL
jgi:hypothetical protein